MASWRPEFVALAFQARQAMRSTSAKASGRTGCAFRTQSLSEAHTCVWIGRVPTGNRTNLDSSGQSIVQAGNGDAMLLSKRLCGEKLLHEIEMVENTVLFVNAVGRDILQYAQGPGA